MNELKRIAKEGEDRALLDYYNRLIEADNRNSEPYYIVIEERRPGMFENYTDLFKFSACILGALLVSLSVWGLAWILSGLGWQWLKTLGIVP